MLERREYQRQYYQAHRKEIIAKLRERRKLRGSNKTNLKNSKKIRTEEIEPALADQPPAKKQKNSSTIPTSTTTIQQLIHNNGDKNQPNLLQSATSVTQNGSSNSNRPPYASISTGGDAHAKIKFYSRGELFNVASVYQMKPFKNSFINSNLLFQSTSLTALRKKFELTSQKIFKDLVTISKPRFNQR